MAMQTAVSEGTLKLSTLFVEVMLIAALAGCAGSPTRESTGEFVDDSAITAKVKTTLLDDKVTRGLKVHVSTFKGVVELTGSVMTDADKRRAEQVASSIAGVKSVANGLVVKSGS